VEPAVQTGGIGRRLMEEFDRRCDRAGRAGYLETIRWADASKPPLERFYSSLGFEVRDIVPMTDTWEVLTMTRPPRAIESDTSTASHE
jgi:GNAT superfamily N-acetyltransferase